MNPGNALKIIATVLGLVAACVACCAAPALGPLLAAIFAGSALASVAVHAAGWIAGVGAVGAAVLLLRQRRKANRAALQNRCDCSEARNITSHHPSGARPRSDHVVDEACDGPKEPSSAAATALSRSQISSPSQQREPASP